MFILINFDLFPRLETPRILRIFLSSRQQWKDEDKTGDCETLRWIKTRRYARNECTTRIL